MNCFEARNEILEIENNDYKNLSVLSEEARKHIENCKDCRAYLDELCEMQSLLKAAQPLPVKNGVTLHEHIAARIARGDTATPLAQKRRFFPVATLAAVAAVVAVVCIGGLPLGNLADKFSGSASENEAAIHVADAEAQAIGGVYKMADKKMAVPESSAEEAEQTEAAEDSIMMAKNYASLSDGSSAEVVTYGLGKSKITGGTNATADTKYVVDENGAIDAGNEEALAAPAQGAARIGKSVGETTSAYDPKEDISAEPEMFSENVPMLMSVADDELDTEEAEAEIEREANEKVRGMPEEEILDATILTVEEESDFVPQSAQDVINLAAEFFQKNKAECFHKDNCHVITLEMAKAVGEEKFVEWYIRVAHADMESLYTIDAFNKYFDID